ncbi:toll-like receptor 8 [Melanotaenia boesemani]|uniref:toll-like receptor 8 n=1 Tax=Melanotaenia boesemani TaxID=1250792 RepID=UPI001C04A140|nr:toll-like receptor 8 [Melanotaenia boesemani]
MMTFTCWLHLLLLCLCCHHDIQVAASKPFWMSQKFPCDVTAPNTSEVLFDCKGRHLKKLPYGITSNATGLDLSENFIKTVAVNTFSHLPNLTRLNLSWANKKKGSIIEDNAFKNLTKLHKLKLAGNCLKGIPGNLPVSVEILDLHNNKIMYLDNNSFAGLTNLTQLVLSRNCYMWNPCKKNVQIMDNTFTGMTKLEALDLSFNNLSQVPQGLPQSLIILNLGSNKIQHMYKGDFQGLQNLQVLSIQGNCPRCHNAPFPCVPCPNVSLVIDADAFKNLTQLEQLNLGGNSLQYLNPSWFEKLNKLKRLSVSFNFLLKAITEEATFLTHLPSLEVINLSFNYALSLYPTTVNLSKEFSTLTSLRTLHMEGLVFQKLGLDTLRPLYELKHLSTLNLGTNFIIQSDSNIFRHFHHLKTIYLAENRLYPTPGTNTQSPNGGYQQRSDISISPIAKHHPKDFTYDITHGLIKQECFDSGRVLILSANNLFFISPQQFEGYGDIACLNLSGNGFSAALNGTEFSLLPNLTYLDLSFNKIDLAYDNAFKELQKLQVLDLSHNEHYFKAFGITHNLNFMENLPVLRVLNMSYNSISKLTTKQMKSKSLAELKFRHNFLGTLWKERDGSYEKLFYGLTNLTNLDISQNKIGKIPLSVYENLPRNLIKLCISHNFLTDFSWTSLKFFHQLQILDLSFNSLSHVAGINSNITQTLIFLDLSHNHIFHLETGFFTGPKSLKTLSLSYNKLTTINQSTFQPGPENQLKTLLLQKNPFQCTCDSLDFILWIESSNVKIPRLTTAVKCDTPVNQRDKALIYFDIMECVNDSQAFLMYIITTSFIIMFMFVATASQLFYWDASYMLHYVKAKLKGYRSLHSTHNVYDVFVAYDTKDPHVSEWVMKNLRVKLEEEGEKHLPLCLEERDWPPGVPLVDNLTQSIQYSRKTMFVLTEGYVKTGTFKLAMYLAHQRLLDENVDVIVLLMLEPVLQHSHFLRLRRRLCGKSVMEWPRTAAAEPWFWQNLRNVMRVDNQLMYNKTYSNYFTSK